MLSKSCAIITTQGSLVNYNNQVNFL